MASTPIIRISQLPIETEKTISGNPANTWFAIVNADVMKTKRVSLESLMKYFSDYFAEPAPFDYINVSTEGGLKANGSSFEKITAGNTVTLSDKVTFDHSNSSFVKANSSYGHANGSFLKSNLSFVHSNSSFNHANSAFVKANSVIDLYGSGGISLYSSNPDSSKLYLGQQLYAETPPVEITTTNGLSIDGVSGKSVFLGQNIVIGANPITINTLNGISGGKQVDLGETINLDGSFIYNHANSSYNYANNCMVKPAINYVTSAQNNIVAIANGRYIIIGDSSSNIHIKLPEGVPKVNTFIYFTNMTSSKNNTIQYNGTRIHGLSPNEHLRLDIPNVSITMCYVDSTRGWVIV